MACNSDTCQSGCSGDAYSGNDDDREQKQKQDAANGESSNGVSAREGGICIKCKVNETIAATNPDVIKGGGDARRFCADCFRSNLYGKFKLSVTSHAMISPSDNILLAFSGGTSSRVLLQFVHEMQSKAQKNFDASRDRSLPVFGVGVAYIDESTIPSGQSSDVDIAINEMKRQVSSLGLPAKSFHVFQLENLYPVDSTCRRNPITELFDAVSDTTGKDDLLMHLRMRSLQKIASDNGYTKVALGTCTSRIACHVLEATVKGQGFSLAADIQYVDARLEIPVVLPLRDCLSEELTMLCSLDGLKPIKAFQQPRSGINGLISSFVKLLQEENPSRESTIMRTAGKLTPFSFNRIPEVDNHDDRFASQRRQKKYNLKPNESLPPALFCFVCNSPLKKPNDTILNGFENEEMGSGNNLAACSSCQYQILPKDPSAFEYFHSLLPQPTTTKSCRDNQKLLREQVQDFLISDNDDEP